MPPSDMNAPALQALFLAIDAALPQTQCTRCGYPDCAGYAQAIASGEAPINQCSPGGQEGIERLARITGQSALPLNAEHGVEGPRHVAVIDEAWCIGCTLCIKACPTDAIVGANQRMHTVIAPWCTGCELCIPVCPVDCIGLDKVSEARTGWAAWSAGEAQTARQRYQVRQARLAREDQAHQARKMAEAEETLADLAAHTKLPSGPDASAEAARKRAIIEAALAKAKARQSGA